MCTLRRIAERQEQEDTSRTRHVVQHSNHQRYILNTQGLHGIKHIRRALHPSLLEWRRLCVDPQLVHREAVQKLASATVNKALQAEARKVAKENFKAVLEGGRIVATDSETDQRPTKRQRTKRSQRITHSVNHTSTGQNSLSTSYPRPSPNVQTADGTPTIAPASNSRTHPVPTDTSTPSSYSDFWAQFHRVI
jgi:hypothetical protein